MNVFAELHSGDSDEHNASAAQEGHHCSGYKAQIEQYKKYVNQLQDLGVESCFCHILAKTGGVFVRSPDSAQSH